MSWDTKHRYEIALRNLNPDGWAKMTETEKVECLQAIEDKLALDQGRIAAEIRTEELSGISGYQNLNSIVVDSKSLENSDYLEVIDTLYHEGSHVKDWQAGFISEVRSGYTAEELKQRSSEIPSPDSDWNGYYHHPAEVSAREAGKEGVATTLSNQEYIVQADAARNSHLNQILETYDDLVLSEKDSLKETDPSIQDNETEAGQEVLADTYTGNITDNSAQWEGTLAECASELETSDEICNFTTPDTADDVAVGGDWSFSADNECAADDDIGLDDGIDCSLEG